MKILQKQNLFQKIVIMLIFLILFNFTVPTYSQADLGGLLLSPFKEFVLIIGDGIMWMLHWCFTGSPQTVISTAIGPFGGAEVKGKASGDTNTRSHF